MEDSSSNLATLRSIEGLQEPNADYLTMGVEDDEQDIDEFSKTVSTRRRRGMLALAVLLVLGFLIRLVVLSFRTREVLTETEKENTPGGEPQKRIDRLDNLDDGNTPVNRRSTKGGSSSGSKTKFTPPSSLPDRGDFTVPEGVTVTMPTGFTMPASKPTLPSNFQLPTAIPTGLPTYFLTGMPTGYTTPSAASVAKAAAKAKNAISAEKASGATSSETRQKLKDKVAEKVEERDGGDGNDYVDIIRNITEAIGKAAKGKAAGGSSSSTTTTSAPTTSTTTTTTANSPTTSTTTTIATTAAPITTTATLPEGEIDIGPQPG
eukprot:gb/GEZN01012750.1/.p1 GENE.gb/GEZN01012750.1/~~gb/GEZN01012750.1/.p1  ORF type:complete len:338 (-),score=66.92 gb/GEZN01012750.1/:44-1003(-)